MERGRLSGSLSFKDGVLGILTRMVLSASPFLGTGHTCRSTAGEQQGAVGFKSLHKCALLNRCRYKLALRQCCYNPNLFWRIDSAVGTNEVNAARWNASTVLGISIGLPCRVGFGAFSAGLGLFVQRGT